MDNPVLDKILSGQPLQPEDGLAILQSRGAELSKFLAGAHFLKEKTFGDRVHLCSIINAKSGQCRENCRFCAQSSHHATQAAVYPLKSEEELVAGAHEAAKRGAHCYGIVTSGTQNETQLERHISEKTKAIVPVHYAGVSCEMDRILESLRRIRRETDIAPSASLGLLDEEWARALAEAGCATYHHNLETARSFFSQICTTHDYEQDVETVRLAKKAGMKVCCGGLFGLGESLEQRVELAMTLRELDVDSVPLNFLDPVAGTPLEKASELTPMDCIRIIALFRYMLPTKEIAVCGGREHNLRELQSWIFMAGASGTMVGNYLTTSGRDLQTDMLLLQDTEVQADACQP